MFRTDHGNERTLEVILVLTSLALACLLYYSDSAQIVVLNLFYLPIVLAGFFLGRYRSGALALLSVIAASIVITCDLTRFSVAQSPVLVILSVMVWGAALGLTSILVGTLCEDRNARTLEAHEAHVGVVEVLSRYLQSADPVLQTHALTVVKLCEQVAVRLRLSHKEIDDLRVAAMLMDMENIEITARVIRKAVGELEDGSETAGAKTIHGTELVRSLGSVLSGAFPMVLAQVERNERRRTELPLGARILHATRAFVELSCPRNGGPTLAPAEAIEELRLDTDAGYDPSVLFVLEQIVCDDSAAVPPANSTTSRDLPVACARG
ncbi:hypothetical protein Mal4_32070 [Maioricimonas rarisocia]|uniref:HD-GYP domain-containing protein n=1 Tax=Maioricimonas rarisocia TaxID=2528026 RepID=A0A517Z8S7_9PLAN|nr:HD domain-containing phosphohydrolase [Maioricimonas rarisocia]QDU38875.1 hypothetical protein Mal4_32070 [Maioricimonas rarisocia]